MANQTNPGGDAASFVPWQTLDQWRASAFLLAGGLILGFVASNALEAFTATVPPTWLNTFFVAPALVAAMVGLLGFYPLLTDHAPRVALASAVVVTVAGTAAVALLAVVTANVLFAGGQLPFFPIYFVTLLATILGFGLVGTASVVTARPSRTVGLLVLGPPAVNIIMIVTAPMNPPLWSTFLISAMWCIAVLAIGIALRSSSTQRTPADRPIDTPTK